MVCSAKGWGDYLTDGLTMGYKVWQRWCGGHWSWMDEVFINEVICRKKHAPYDNEQRQIYGNVSLWSTRVFSSSLKWLWKHWKIDTLQLFYNLLLIKKKKKKNFNKKLIAASGPRAVECPCQDELLGEACCLINTSTSYFIWHVLNTYVFLSYSSLNWIALSSWLTAAMTAKIKGLQLFSCITPGV